MEITGIASQFAMQSRPICDASRHMRRKNCDALLGYDQGTRCVNGLKLSAWRHAGCSDALSLWSALLLQFRAIVIQSIDFLLADISE